MVTTGNNEQYMTVPEACNYVGVSRRTLERYVEQGLLSRYRRGLRTVVYKKSDLDELKRFLTEVKPDDD